MIGADEHGEILTRGLQEVGVDISWVMTSTKAQLATGKADIYTDDKGTRSIYLFPGTNSALGEAKSASDDLLKKLGEYASTSEFLHLSSFVGSQQFQLQEELVQIAPSNVHISLSPGALYTKLGADRLRILLAHASVLFVYEKLFELVGQPFRGRASKSECERCVRLLFDWKRNNNLTNRLIVVVKRPLSMPESRRIRSGIFEDPIVVAGCTSLEEIVRMGVLWPERRCPPLTDSTGAGDAFSAGVLFGILKRRPLQVCANIGYAMAILASSEVGCRDGLPTIMEREAIYRGLFGTPL